MKTLWGALLAVCIFLAGCGGDAAEKHSRNFFAMDTYMTITAYGPHAEEGMKEAEARIRTLEDGLSVTKEGSDVWRVNHRTEDSTDLGADAADAVGAALTIAKDTQGALDPTIYPVVEAWGFTKDHQQVPSPEALADALARTGWTRARLDGRTLTLEPGMEIDLGAVGKGYAGREAGRVLREAGVTSAILSLGGNIEAVGAKPDGTPWKVGLKAPDSEGYAGMIAVKDAAVVTSGSYERYFTDEQGRRYHHILDPATGRPAENELLSVTVVGPDGLVCDALSTALFVMGKDRAAAYWRARGDFAMILIEEGRRVTVTDNLAEDFSLLPDYTDKQPEVLRR